MGGAWEGCRRGGRRGAGGWQESHLIHLHRLQRLMGTRWSIFRVGVHRRKHAARHYRRSHTIRSPVESAEVEEAMGWVETMQSLR